MTESEHPEPDEQPEKTRPALEKPDRSEKALGLEVAKLFGLPPRLLVKRPAPPPSQSTSDGDGTADGGGEDAEPVQGGG